MEEGKINHKPDKKSKKKSKKSDLRKIQAEQMEPETTNHDLEEDRQLNGNEFTEKKKLTEEEQKAEREIKYEKVRKCYLEAGLCCFMLLLGGIFIYLFEFTDVIRERPE